MLYKVKVTIHRSVIKKVSDYQYLLQDPHVSFFFVY